MFLTVQNTYHHLELALFIDNHLIDTRTENKHNASKCFVMLLDDLLRNQNCSLPDISFIAANQGPGPFSTLRVVIASVNGLSFATNIPLIGVDGLNAFLQEYYDPKHPNTVVLLNAFAGDVYFGIQQNTQESTVGYKKINLLLHDLQKQIPDKPIRFLGNAVELYQDKIYNTFKSRTVIPAPLPHFCSIKQVGLIGLEQWKKQDGLTHQLFPLYLKKHPVEMQIR